MSGLVRVAYHPARMSPREPNPYAAPVTDRGKPPPWLELRPGQAWPPICFRCAAPADRQPALRLLVVKGALLRIVPLALGFSTAYLLRDRWSPLAVGALVFVTGSFASLIQPRLVTPVPHCAACAPRALRAERLHLIADPLLWLLIAVIWAAPSVAVSGAALVVVIAGSLALRTLTPRRLLVLQREPTLRIGNLDPAFASRIGAAQRPGAS